MSDLRSPRDGPDIDPEGPDFVSQFDREFGAPQLGRPQPDEGPSAVGPSRPAHPAAAGSEIHTSASQTSLRKILSCPWMFMSIDDFLSTGEWITFSTTAIHKLSGDFLKEHSVSRAADRTAGG